MFENGITFIFSLTFLIITQKNLVKKEEFVKLWFLFVNFEKLVYFICHQILEGSNIIKQLIL